MEETKERGEEMEEERGIRRKEFEVYGRIKHDDRKKKGKKERRRKIIGERWRNKKVRGQSVGGGEYVL